MGRPYGQGGGVAGCGVADGVVLSTVRVGDGVCRGEVPVPVGVRPAVLDGLATPVGVGLTLRVGETVLDGDVEYDGDGNGCVGDFGLCLG